MACALALAACGTSGDGPLFRDHPTPADPPGELRSFTIPSHGDTLLARAFLADGPGPHPLVLLLHGFPGSELSFDVAHALRRSGWSVAIVHYRGSWGSSGSFSFTGVLQDVDAMIDYLVSPEVAEELRSEPGSVYLVGHSMGGFAAVYTAAHRREVAGVASIAGFNFGASAEWLTARPEARNAVVEAFAEALPPLNASSAEALVDEYLAAGRRWDLAEMVDDLRAVPVLLVAGSSDGVAPPGLHHRPLHDALVGSGHPDVSVRELEDGHGFLSSRITLTAVISRWLERIRAPPGPSSGP